MEESSKKLVLQTFEKYIKNYRAVNPNDNLDDILAKQLPKICVDDTSKAIINKVNEILGAEIALRTPLSIEDLHTLTYCAARTTVELCKQHNLVYEQSEIPTKFPEDKDIQKKLFQHSPQRFRRLLFENTSNETAKPQVKDIEKFWSELWEEKNSYKEEILQYVKDEEERTHGVNAATNYKVYMTDLKKALKMKKNWSPPGIDGVQTFWYKKFKPVRKALLKKINDIIEKDEQMPEFFTVGLTELSSKGGNPEDPSNYRPITHLPAIYKIITRCVYQKIFQHYEEFGILADEQCGGRKDCYGVRKALILDSIALNQEEVRGYYVDFKKAFDSIPHDWMIKMLNVYKVDRHLIRFLDGAMKKWKTRIYLKPDILTRTIELKRGIFQGDSTSVILFWTAINPLSFALRRRGWGLTLGNGRQLSHVLYMDDLKLYSPNKENLDMNYEEVKKFANAINMTINEKKTSKFSVPLTSEKSEQLYVGYIQTPKINTTMTMLKRIQRVDKKCEKITLETKLSEGDKTYLKEKFVFNAFFNTFGILPWAHFKNELILNAKTRQKFLRVVQEQGKGLPPIYLKLIHDMCMMRKKFNRSEFIKNIVQNDAVTPLRLSMTDEEEYVKRVVAEIREKLRNTEKASEM